MRQFNNSDMTRLSTIMVEMSHTPKSIVMLGGECVRVIGAFDTCPGLLPDSAGVINSVTDGTYTHPTIRAMIGRFAVALAISQLGDVDPADEDEVADMINAAARAQISDVVDVVIQFLQSVNVATDTIAPLPVHASNMVTALQAAIEVAVAATGPDTAYVKGLRDMIRQVQSRGQFVVVFSQGD